MGQKVFIPVTDELLFDRPELISAPLRPYTEDMACYHWMDVRLNPEDDDEVTQSYQTNKNSQAELGNASPRSMTA